MTAPDLVGLSLELEEAWLDFQNFGNHEGECGFGPNCTKCGTPTGQCEMHAEMMKIRTTKMDAAVFAVVKALT